MLDFIVVCLYLLGIVAVGVYVGKFSSTTSDFFFGGRRFSWWLVGISCVATLVGSYSFISYSEVGFKHGMTSLVPYTNEWFVLPIFLGVWLPLVYYNRLESVPEYFEKRFSPTVRKLVIFYLAVYLTGYIGVNLLTIGVALKGIFTNDPDLSQAMHFDALKSLPSLGGFLDWQIIIPAIVVAVLSAAYLHSGGQTSVIITDVLQGFLLLLVGIGVFLLGIYQLGGFDTFLAGMPESHLYPFAKFNEPSDFHFVGDFWNDAMVGSFSFYVINQGILMRFMSARSVQDGRKAMIFVAICLMPLAALSVGGAGWIGSALVSNGLMPAEVDPKEVFITVSKIVTIPGVYGFVIAAVIAALMSTLDTLITAVCAIVVNDIVRPLKPGMSDEYYLKVAKQSAVGFTAVGLCLIPVAQKFESIYQALSYFTSVFIPPLIIVVLFGIMTRKFNSKCAIGTLVLGLTAVILSTKFPVLIKPISHGVDMAGGYSYMRSLFGLVASGIVAVILMFTIGGEEEGRIAGMTVDTLDKAIEKFKGGKPNFENSGQSVLLSVDFGNHDDIEIVRLPQNTMDRLAVKPGDLLYITDTRWWWGGLLSVHAKAGGAAMGETLTMDEELFAKGGFQSRAELRVEKVF